MSKLLREFMGGLLFLPRSGSHHSSAGQEVEDEHNDCEDQKDVDPSTQCVAADESYDPEEEENNGDCPKHFAIS
jgi:hypothetical protein